MILETLTPTEQRTTDAAEEHKRLLQSFLLALEASGRSASTQRLYMYGCRRLIKHLANMGLGELPLGSVSAEHLREFLNAERRRGVSPATLASEHKSLRQLWHFLVAEGEVSEDVTKRLPAPRAPEQLVEALTDEQITALLKVCKRDKSILGRRDEAIITMLLDTGLRSAEVLSLTVEGINWRERRCFVLGKASRERVVAFEPRTLLVLQRYHRAARIDGGAIFRSKSREALSQPGLYLMVRRRGKQAGIDNLFPHRLRHTTATALLGAGMQEGDLRQLMGWSRNSNMVARYTQSGAQERALEAREKLRLVQ